MTINFGRVIEATKPDSINVQHYFQYQERTKDVQVVTDETCEQFVMVVKKRSDLRDVHFISCNNDEQLRSALHKVLSNHKKEDGYIKMSAINIKHREFVEKLAHSCNFTFEASPCLLYVYNTNIAQPSVHIPQDVIVKKLSVTDAQLVNSRWTYGSEHTLSYVQFLCEHRPTIGIYVDVNGTTQLVAWALVQEYGAIGMVYVEPEYRGKSFSKILVTNLGEKLLEDGSTPFCYIYHKNDLSKYLFKSLGYEEKATSDWLMLSKI
ncbi:hypothetical protein AKO1_014846 [Acrasis kona]|uniref:N-acetyltransferase domain-containing protein n=1 Tax=Acrasis kona TaxID=1008807 RepID=A0AAW2Z3J1_9EUKA